MGGCNKVITWLEENQEDQFSWSEDIQLSNGETIVANRTARLSANMIAGGGGGSFNKGMTLTITPSNYLGRPAEPMTWSDLYVPLLLDYDEKKQEWFIVATFFHCDSWNNLGRPPLPYTEYRFRKNVWQQQELSPELIGRTTNLYIADQPPPKNHLTISEKWIIIKRRPGIGKKYLSIINQWSTGC